MSIELDNKEFYVESNGVFFQVSTINSKESEDYFFIMFDEVPTFIGYLCRSRERFGEYEDLEKPLDFNSVVKYLNKGEPFPSSFGRSKIKIERKKLDSLLLVLLIHKLQELEDSSTPYSEYLYNNFPNSECIVYLADSVLITEDGYINETNRSKLERKGYRVSPGEKDSFGWLSGIILTEKGRIVFG